MIMGQSVMLSKFVLDFRYIASFRKETTQKHRPQSPRVVSDPRFGASDTEQVEAAAQLGTQGQRLRTMETTIDESQTGNGSQDQAGLEVERKKCRYGLRIEGAGYGGTPLPSRLGCLGSVVSSPPPSRVRGKAPAENDFGAFRGR